MLREKRREERVAELTGWRCIRITWADLAYPERLRGDVLPRAVRRSTPPVTAVTSPTRSMHFSAASSASGSA